MGHEDELKWLLQPFNDAVDGHELRREWEEWHRGFELVLKMKRIESQNEKFVTMLACGGRGLQRIFFNLPTSPDETTVESVAVPMLPKEDPEYDNALIRLNKFFVGKRNERVELEQFRSLRQKVDEPFNQFALKLRRQARRCDFGAREDDEILHQIAMGARDEKVRDKGVENTIDLDTLTNYAINREVLLKLKEKERPFKSEGEGGSVSNIRSERSYKGGSSQNKSQSARNREWTGPSQKWSPSESNRSSFNNPSRANLGQTRRQKNAATADRTATRQEQHGAAGRRSVAITAVELDTMLANAVKAQPSAIAKTHIRGRRNPSTS